MDRRKLECFQKNRENGRFSAGEKFCGLYFDGFLCWPATAAGQEAVQTCPHLDSEYEIMDLKNATRKCEPNGTWYIHPETNATWTDYSMCPISFFNSETALIDINVTSNHNEFVIKWVPVLKTISHVGYWSSILLLILCVAVFVSIKKLQCSRNILHTHLFISIILRSIMFFVKEFAFVEGIGLSNAVVVEKGKSYVTENYHWICKAITSFWFYFTQANFMFILMEGVYLHNLIHCNLLSDVSSVRIYYLFGWGLPTVFLSTWAYLRHIYDNELCWTTANNKYLPLLVKLPIELSMVINFFLFVSITKLLCVKINSMYLQQKQIKYRRLIRSTLTLVLIYGVPFTLSVLMGHCGHPMVERVWIFYDQTFTSFQGVFAGLLYCVLNGEVQMEVKHKYNSMRSKHQQKRRSRTISNTQYSLPLQEDPFEPLKVYWHRTSENL